MSEKANRFVLAVNCAFLTVLLGIPVAESQVIFQLNQITSTPLQPNLAGTNLAILYQPPANSKSHVGIFIMHPDAGYSTFSGWTGLAQRPLLGAFSRRADP